MPLDIKDPEADRLASELARRRGVSVAEAVLAALREQIRREDEKSNSSVTAGELLEIGKRYSSLPILDDRPEEEILGYDQQGLPRR
ncbi:type II toxin-antitoxin system VapB family antitoxin [Skermanella rosea]|uniref:type II toxin-antitoxin system VapB family antitoxin n=1 Tax=Skermanella rosea TaxID=1817965 RepID=UPI001933DFD1|nr:type II toxin-antitoxin system VapB family antitoxin [Skermanella rosea]UEM02142.1 type II toxin-antitoxin system VapB family antitoxin [Skermanella rosea]